jgi:hypothetical protein
MIGHLQIEFNMTFGIFEEVESLIEYIPIDCDTFQIDGRLAKGTSIDSKFYFEDIDGIATTLSNKITYSSNCYCSLSI